MKKTCSIQHCVREHVDVHQFRVFDFVSTTTVAPRCMPNVVQSLLGIDYRQTPVDFHSFESQFLAALISQPLNRMHQVENRMGHGDGFKWRVGKTQFDFTSEGLVPRAVRATRAYEQEPTLCQVAMQLSPFLLVQREIFVSRHDTEWEVE